MKWTRDQQCTYVLLFVCVYTFMCMLGKGWYSRTTWGWGDVKNSNLHSLTSPIPTHAHTLYFKYLSRKEIDLFLVAITDNFIIFISLIPQVEDYWCKLCFFFDCSGGSIQGSMLARQALYHFSHNPILDSNFVWVQLSFYYWRYLIFWSLWYYEKGVEISHLLMKKNSVNTVVLDYPALEISCPAKH
jgi:hypothetical protein